MTPLACHTRAAALLAAMALAVSTAPSLWAQDRCERYAQRAVEQYKLMRSHPSCQVKPDLRWQDSYKNHLFACRHTPELLTKAEEAARDQHLQSCGGLTPEPAVSPAPPGQPSVPPGGQPSVPPPTQSPAPPPAAGTAAAPTATPCKVDLPPSFALAYGTYGTEGEITDGVLRYQDTKKHDRKTYKVVRPTYYAEQQKCGQRPATTEGPWLYRSADGKSDLYFLLNPNKTVQAWPMRHELLEQMVAAPKP